MDYINWDLKSSFFMFFFSSRRRHTRCGRDWSSDVCSSDLIEDDPDPEGFEAWLLERCLSRAETDSMGAMRAMARDVLAEWRFALGAPAFPGWAGAGAPRPGPAVKGG